MDNLTTELAKKSTNFYTRSEGIFLSLQGILVLLSALVMPSVTSALLGEPTSSSEDERIARHEEIRETHLTVLGYQVGKHTLENIESKLGRAKDFHSKDDPHGKSICYVSDRPGDNTKIVFTMSHSQVGFVSFTLLSGEFKLNNSKNCTPSSVVSKNVSTASGLKLGMSPEQLKILLGTPSKEEKGRLYYVFIFQKPITGKELEDMRKKRNHDEGTPKYIYIYSWVEAIFKNSRLIAIEVSRNEGI